MNVSLQRKDGVEFCPPPKFLEPPRYFNNLFKKYKDKKKHLLNIHFQLGF